MNKVPFCLPFFIVFLCCTLAAIQQQCFAQSRKGVWDARQQQTSTQVQSRSTSAQPDGRYSSSPQRNATARTAEVMETLVSGGLRRRYMVHVPPTYSSSRPAPVVLLLHGAGMNIDSMRGLTLMDLVADRNGFLAVYPEGVSGGWNAGGLKNKSTENDVAFIADVLRHLQSKYAVDRQAVYACGISNGGQMTERLACELSDQIAAIGVVAITGIDSVCKSCTARRPMPVMFFIGTDDPLCPRENSGVKQLGALGESLGLGDLPVTPQLAKMVDIMTAEDVIEFWAQHNGAGSGRQERIPDRNTRDGCTAIKETFGGGDREVVSYTIDGGGHTWPGGMGFVIEGKLGKTCMDVNASELLWDFFKSHRRR